MQTVVTITGKTYPHRRDIRACGGIWCPELECWIVTIEKENAVRNALESYGFDFGTKDVPDEYLEKPSGERLRAIRQAKIDRRIARMEHSIAIRRTKIDEIQKSIEPYNDLAFWTEPIKIGHHSERRHRNLRAKIENKLGKGADLYREMADLEQRVSWAKSSGARIAGDADRRKEALRSKLDEILTVGSRVRSPSFGLGTIVKVHKKSYTVRWDSSNGGTGPWQCSVDKTYVQPVFEK